MKSRGGNLDSPSGELDWRGYEELVKAISEALGREHGVTIECWGRKCTVEGPPGITHQVDVLTAHIDGIQRYRTAISCRWRERRVGISHVRDLAFIVQEAHLSKGVIVSKNGFTKPAKRLAKAKNIGLIELRKPTDEDWGDSLSEVHVEIVMDMGLALSDVRFRRALPTPSSGGEHPDERTTMPDSPVILMPGQDGKTLYTLAEEAHRDSPEQEEFEIEFPEGTVLRTPKNPEHDANGRGVAAVSFKLQPVPPLRSKLAIRAEDQIYMIMRDLFENRHFNITTDSQIIEVGQG